MGNYLTNALIQPGKSCEHLNGWAEPRYTHSYAWENTSGLAWFQLSGCKHFVQLGPKLNTKMSSKHPLPILRNFLNGSSTRNEHGAGNLVIFVRASIVMLIFVTSCEYMSSFPSDFLSLSVKTKILVCFPLSQKEQYESPPKYCRIDRTNKMKIRWQNTRVTNMSLEWLWPLTLCRSFT